MQFDLPEPSPGATVAIVDQHPSQVTWGPANQGSRTPRGLSVEILTDLSYEL